MHRQVRLVTEDEKQPWWNDKDKAGGMAATIVMLGLAFVILAVFIRIGVWILP